MSYSSSRHQRRSRSRSHDRFRDQGDLRSRIRSHRSPSPRHITKRPIMEASISSTSREEAGIKTADLFTRRDERERHLYATALTLKDMDSNSAKRRKKDDNEVDFQMYRYPGEGRYPLSRRPEFEAKLNDERQNASKVIRKTVDVSRFDDSMMDDSSHLYSRSDRNRERERLPASSHGGEKRDNLYSDRQDNRRLKERLGISSHSDDRETVEVKHIGDRLGSYYKQLKDDDREDQLPRQNLRHNMQDERLPSFDRRSRGLAPYGARWFSGRGGNLNMQSRLGYQGDEFPFRKRADADEKNVVRLFDPTKVPTGGRFFLHDDREKEFDEILEFNRGRGITNRFPRFFRSRFSYQSRGNYPRFTSESDNIWDHDMFEKEAIAKEKSTS